MKMKDQGAVCAYWAAAEYAVNVKALEASEQGRRASALVHVSVRRGYRLLVRAAGPTPEQLESLFKEISMAYEEIEK